MLTPTTSITSALIGLTKRRPLCGWITYQNCFAPPLPLIRSEKSARMMMRIRHVAIKRGIMDIANDDKSDKPPE
eukprot:216530-Ditylum_brightwellii.AAC.1